MPVFNKIGEKKDPSHNCRCSFCVHDSNVFRAEPEVEVYYKS